MLYIGLVGAAPRVQRSRMLLGSASALRTRPLAERTGRGATAALLVLSVVATASVAGAQSEPVLRSVALRVVRCSEGPEPFPNLVQQLGTELRSAGIEVRSAIEPSTDAARLVLLPPICHHGAGIVVRIQRATAERTFERTLDTPDPSDPESGRLLALAVVEALRGGWRTLTRPAETPDVEERLTSLERTLGGFDTRVSRIGARVDEENWDSSRARDDLRERLADVAEAVRRDTAARRDAARRARATPALDLELALSVFSYPNTGVGVFGPSLGLRATLLDGLRLAVQAAYLFGERSDPLGTAALHGASADLGLEWHVRRAPLIVALGGWIGGGVQAAIGSPSDPEATAGGTLVSGAFAAGARLVLAAEVSDSFALRAQIDGGFAPWGLDARSGERRIAHLVGPVIAVRFGLVWGS